MPAAHGFVDDRPVKGDGLARHRVLVEREHIELVFSAVKFVVRREIPTALGWGVLRRGEPLEDLVRVGVLAGVGGGQDAAAGGSPIPPREVLTELFEIPDLIEVRVLNPIGEVICEVDCEAGLARAVARADDDLVNLLAVGVQFGDPLENPLEGAVGFVVAALLTVPPALELDFSGLYF